MTGVLGFLELDHLWVDDRRTGRWALRGLTLAVEPGTTVAITGDVTAADAVVDLLAGHRCPVRGRVAVDGIDLRDLARDELEEIAIELVSVGGSVPERRVQLGRTAIVSSPRPPTQAAADLVLVLLDGVEVDRVSGSAVTVAA